MRRARILTGPASELVHIRTFMINYQRQNGCPPTISEISAHLRRIPPLYGTRPGYSRDLIHRRLQELVNRQQVKFLGTGPRCYTAVDPLQKTRPATS